MPDYIYPHGPSTLPSVRLSSIFSPTAESRNKGHSQHAQSHHMQVTTPALHLSFLSIQDTRYIVAFLLSVAIQTFPAQVNLILYWNTEDVAFLGHLQTLLAVCGVDWRRLEKLLKVRPCLAGGLSSSHPMIADIFLSFALYLLSEGPHLAFQYSDLLLKVRSITRVQAV